MGAFHYLGTPVRADETRSAAVCRNAEGKERVVIAARGYVLIVDPVSGECKQLPFPEGQIDYPFASMSDSSGLLYTGAGRMLMVLDPFGAEFVWWFNGEQIPEEEILGFAFVETEDNIVYATTYPGCKLLKVDPAAGECTLATRLDPEQKYAMTLAADCQGWIYAGIGTKEALLCAYHPASGTRIHPAADELGAAGGSAVSGSGQVHRGSDGEVYASLPAVHAEAKDGQEAAPRWFRLHGGQALPVAAEEVAPSVYAGSGYQKLHRNLSGGRRIVAWQLAEGELVIEEADGRMTVLPLQYDGSGTALSPIIGGPDGRLYGTSNHPLHLYRYDPKNKELTNFGAKVVEGGGGGNICAYAAQGPILLGAAYAGGKVYLLDTRKDPSPQRGTPGNPRLIYADDSIHRPRCAAAHSDGEHILYGGFPGYGAVGGGLGVVHVASETVTIYPHDQIVPFQSTLGLAVLSTGGVIGGTSIETPGGAEPIAREAVLYRLNWQSRRVERRWTPVPGAKEISLIACDSQDRIHGLTSDSIYFVFDPHRECLLASRDLSDWGRIVRQGLIPVQQGGQWSLYGLLSGALFRIDPDLCEPVLLSATPKEATSGLVYIAGSLFFGCGSELWQYEETTE
ncbi:hypothetical protein [Paenibacillus sp. J2TS4]|uniref:hypothetical protein n=1 Tax=Paenibacillus sp. J2TS4 TaxID=2807194 RepID=UPI001B24AE73|nr:hypothetical protein [Paenibacillus sp. J2TS4]GIP31601.1 hypothetical protein J2TS4_08110 [Paenibacillus sp. J2TS4]